MVARVSMALSQWSSRARGSSAGIAALEFVIVLPLLGLLLLVTLETGRVLHQYMLLSHIAGTAVRSGIQLAGLGEGCFEAVESGKPLFLNLGYLPNQPANNRHAPHWLAQRRAYTLLLHSKDDILLHGGPSAMLKDGYPGPDMTSEYVRLFDRAPSSNCDSVKQAGGDGEKLNFTFGFRLQGDYTPLIFPISFPMTIESRASYLHGNSNFPLAGGAPCRPRTRS
jgi:hypothetical protein